MNVHTCQNCSHQFEGKFCNHCGQSVEEQRIGSRTFLKEMKDKFHPFGKDVLPMAKRLIFSPVQTTRDYLECRRKSLVSPISYVATLAGLYFLASKNFAPNEAQQKPFDSLTTVSAEVRWLLNEGYALFTEYYAVFTMLLLLPLALFCYLLFHRKGKNFFEHLYIVAYTISGSFLVKIALGYLIWSANLVVPVSGLMDTLLLATPIFGFIMYGKFFSNSFSVVNGLLFLLAYLLQTILLVFCLIGIIKILTLL